MAWVPISDIASTWITRGIPLKTLIGEFHLMGLWFGVKGEEGRARFRGIGLDALAMTKMPDHLLKRESEGRRDEGLLGSLRVSLRVS